MGDDALKTIARELVESVRRTASIDWKENAQVGAYVCNIRRLLVHCGYPLEKQPAATNPVMQQAELFAHSGEFALIARR